MIQQLLDDLHPILEISYLGSARGLEVYRIYRRIDDSEIGQLRFYDNGEKQFLRFDLPETLACTNPLVVSEDEDGNNWTCPGWNTINEFLEILNLYPITIKKRLT